MRHAIFYIIVLMLPFFGICNSVPERDKISEKEVPANVRNAFNRIYIDQDPAAWFVDEVKPKGSKKTKRYTAEYVNRGRSHLVRFDDEGIPVGEYYVLNEKMSNHVTKQLTYEYPNHTVAKVESLWMFDDNLSVFMVLLEHKSKYETIFIDEQGIEVFDEGLKSEFEQS